MKWLAAVPLVLSSLLIGAHFLRAGELVLLAICLAAPLLVLTRQLAAVRAVQLLLLAAAAEWVRTAYLLAVERSADGAPFTRMLIILGAVALFTLLSAVPLRRFARTRGTSVAQAHVRKEDTRWLVNEN